MALRIATCCYGKGMLSFHKCKFSFGNRSIGIRNIVRIAQYPSDTYWIRDLWPKVGREGSSLFYDFDAYRITKLTRTLERDPVAYSYWLRSQTSGHVLTVASNLPARPPADGEGAESRDLLFPPPDGGSGKLGWRAAAALWPDLPPHPHHTPGQGHPGHTGGAHAEMVRYPTLNRAIVRRNDVSRDCTLLCSLILDRLGA